MIKKKYFFLVFLIPVFLIFGCSKNDTNVSKGNKKGILYLGNGSEPQDLDPQTVTGIPELRIVSALFEGLLCENPKTLEPEPGVAKSWTIGKKGLVYTFFLRKNAEWSDGTPLTAEDFVFSYKRMLSPSLAAQNAYMLYCIKNAERFNKGEINDFSDVGIKAVSGHVLQITLNKPIPYFLSLITHMAWFPIDKKNIEKYGDITQRGTKWTLPGNLIGNGPFKLKKWNINKSITVVKNKNYWDAKNVKLNEIVFYPFNDAQTEERAFRSGQLHVTYTVPTSKIGVYEKKNPGIIKITPYLGTYYLIFNVNKKPYNNPLLRKALSLAVNRVNLAKYVVKGGRIPAASFTPPNTAGYTADTKLDFNVQKAKYLLTEAGYPDGEGLPVIELTYSSSVRNRRIVEAIQEMWAKNLNVKTSIINKEWKVYLDSFRTRDFSIATASWIGDYNDPGTFLDLWVTGAGNNRARWSNKEYDKLIEDASDTPNRKLRNNFFNKAEKILINQTPIIPLFYYTSLALIKPEVKGWYPNILDHHPLKNVYLEAN
ncbi:MAG TPA: peptide ABC transporter substrate-binding protein [Victivallales bacterium]|nr:peptide ABC transporter substrate-binding protein [Victivallales bacterium]